jgi:hypothetical protein
MSKDMTVTNCGVDPSELLWSRNISTDIAILGTVSTDINFGALDYNETDTMVVTFNPSGVAQGTYAGSIEVLDTVDTGVEHESLPISVVITPRYTGSLKFTDANVGNGTFSAHSTLSDHELWWIVWAPTSGKLEVRVYHNGTATARMSNSLGSFGATVAVTNLAFRGSDGYPSGGPVSLSAPYVSTTLSFGPDVW